MAHVFVIAKGALEISTLPLQDFLGSCKSRLKEDTMIECGHLLFSALRLLPFFPRELECRWTVHKFAMWRRAASLLAEAPRRETDGRTAAVADDGHFIISARSGGGQPAGEEAFQALTQNSGTAFPARHE